MDLKEAHRVYTDFRIPGIVATEKGALLRYCECRRSCSDWAAIDICVERSEDEGAHWTAVMTLEGEGHTLNNPVMLVDGERLIFLFCKNYKEIWQCASTDDGVTFGTPRRVAFEHSVSFFYTVVAVGPGHGISHGGRLIVPIWFAYNRENEKSHRPSLIGTLYSADHGESWQVGELIGRDELHNPSECALAVTADGHVLISIRHEGEKKARALAQSASGIGEWSGLHFADTLADPVCMAGMTQSNGVLYHVNCNSESKRCRLTVKSSRDGFESFEEIAVFEEGGYADIALIGRKLFVFYEKTVYVPDGKWGPFRLYFDTVTLP